MQAYRHATQLFLRHFTPARETMQTLHESIPMPGLLWGDYPERPVTPKRLAAALRGRAAPARRPAGRPCGLARRPQRPRLAGAGARRRGWRSIRRRCRRRLPAHGARCERDGLHGSALAQAFGLVAAAAQQRLGLVPYDCQLIAARTVLDEPAGRNGHRRRQDAGGRRWPLRSRRWPACRCTWSPPTTTWSRATHSSCSRLRPHSDCASAPWCSPTRRRNAWRPMPATSPTSPPRNSSSTTCAMR